MLCLVAQTCLAICDPTDYSPSGSSVHGNSPGKNTGVDCHAFLQGISPTQVSNPGFPYCRWILYQLSHQGITLNHQVHDNLLYQQLEINILFLTVCVFEEDKCNNFKVWSIYLLCLFICFICLAMSSLSCSIPHQGWNLVPLHWEHGVLATGPPGRSRVWGI